ncbi:hypothetical protein DFP72DRAFT_810571 [Ephemerocybe angulata]|uniref:DUF7330 domain-containing protein n=1 Tax=Ephemerocybe angulata TaxID=980116 RepID=A0A8H6I051_9AGAR|nr:hypothetical protein DFP72DRAFT_810571 [Tulosesus angulatus]
MAASIAGSDGRYDITGSDRGGERNITNYINIARKATPHHRIFSLFYPNPKITDTFYIDPHLKVPGAVLNSIKSSIRTPHVPTTRRGELRAERREQQQDLPKNLTLSLEDGRMDVNIHLIADCDPNSSFTRRLRSKASLSSQSALGSLRKPVVPRTTITASVNATRPKTFKAYPMLIRIFAPQPRPPFFFQATCTGSTSISRSPLTLFIPISFHGPITIKIRVGNIDNHLWMSPAVAGVARMMSEDEQSRGYFLGALPDTLDEEDEDSDDAAVSTRPIISADRDDDEESWQGDKIDIDIGNGRLRILFEDDRLEGTLRGASSNGWIWPAKWG